MTTYWTLWRIGWIFVLVTRIILCAVGGTSRYGEYVEDKSKAYQIVVTILSCICIVLVGGIANGMWLGRCLQIGKLSGSALVSAIMVLGILPAALTYIVGYLVLGLYKFEPECEWKHAIFIITFIVSIVAWTIPIAKYQQNVETQENTSVSSTVDYDLYYFCNIPVQKVSGDIDGSSFLGTGSVSGDISTSEYLSYWYDNGNEEGLYNSVSADDSKIVFIQDGETPFVRIITHCKQKIEIDNNTGEKSVVKETYWETYEFHLPKEIMQYNIGGT